MKRFLRYMYDFRGVCIWAVLSGAVFAAVFALYGIRMEAAWYPILITALFGMIMLAAGFVRYDKRRRNMERILSECRLHFAQKLVIILFLKALRLWKDIRSIRENPVG